MTPYSPWQRYTGNIAQNRMEDGLCPECGQSVQAHSGWGSGWHCSLTDVGVAGRIYQYRQDKESLV